LIFNRSRERIGCGFDRPLDRKDTITASGTNYWMILISLVIVLLEVLLEIIVGFINKVRILGEDNA